MSLLYRVARIEVFGSFLSDKERLSDVDVAVELERKLTGDDFQHASRERVLEAVRAGRRFYDLDDLFWPSTEVLLRLRGSVRGLSLHANGEPQRLGVTSRVIYPRPGTGTAER